MSGNSPNLRTAAQVRVRRSHEDGSELDDLEEENEMWAESRLEEEEEEIEEEAEVAVPRPRPGGRKSGASRGRRDLK